MVATGAAINRRYVQLYDNYDKAFVLQVHHELHYRGTNSEGQEFDYPMPCVFATPERAFAQIAKQIRRRKGLKGDPSPDEIRNVPLPFISITRTDEVVSLDRFVGVYMHRFAACPNGEIFFGVKKPVPYDLTYQVDLWTRNLFMANDITTQMMLWLYSNYFYMTVRHPGPILDRRIFVEFMGMTDNSQLSPQTEEQRELRRTFTFRVEGWVCYEPDTIPIIRSVHTHVIDDYKDPPVELEEWVVTEPLPEGKTPLDANREDT